tara:strand:- start:82 stop:915 length:834 start_codon:yes stop_codon:yes gene_type:complete
MTTFSPDGKWIWNGEIWIPAPPKPVVEQNQNLPPLPQNPIATRNQVTAYNSQINHVEKNTSDSKSEVHDKSISSMSDSVVMGNINSQITNHIMMVNEIDESRPELENLEDWRFAVIAYDVEGDKRELIEEIRDPTAEELLSLTEDWVKKISNVKSRLLSEIKIFIIPGRELLGIEMLAVHGIKYFEQNAGMTVDEFWNCKVIEHNMLVAMAMLPRLEIVWFPDECAFLLNAQLMHYVDYNGVCSTQDYVKADEILEITKWVIEGDVQSLSSYEWEHC